VVFHQGESAGTWGDPEAVSGPMATFRLSSGRDLLLVASLHQDADSDLAADIAFRFAQRLALASAERLERLLSGDEATAEAGATRTAVHKAALEAPAGLVPAASMAALVDLAPTRPARPPMGWLRGAFGRASGLAAPARSLGDD
jgi:UDP-GlcNAc:undecaprenyl-phosphate GlcNAc-1-phosphate transferase